jgi:hypothetical protein
MQNIANGGRVKEGRGQKSGKVALSQSCGAAGWVELEKLVEIM